MSIGTEVCPCFSLQIVVLCTLFLNLCIDILINNDNTLKMNYTLPSLRFLCVSGMLGLHPMVKFAMAASKFRLTGFSAIQARSII